MCRNGAIGSRARGRHRKSRRSRNGQRQPLALQSTATLHPPWIILYGSRHAWKGMESWEVANGPDTSNFIHQCPRPEYVLARLARWEVRLACRTYTTGLLQDCAVRTDGGRQDQCTTLEVSVTGVRVGACADASRTRPRNVVMSDIRITIEGPASPRPTCPCCVPFRNICCIPPTCFHRNPFHHPSTRAMWILPLLGYVGLIGGFVFMVLAIGTPVALPSAARPYN